MKLKQSVFFILALLLLAACGKEEFGSTPTTNASQMEPVQQFSTKELCQPPEEIRPKVDILYIVDNTESTYSLSSSIKLGIKNMVNNVAGHFDYRLIGTSLLPIDSETPFNDYQLMTNTQDPLSAEASSRRIISASEFNFFMHKPLGGGSSEAGLRRAIEFINFNHLNNPGLFRQNANLIVVIFSNGRDTEIEKEGLYGNGETIIDTAAFTNRFGMFNNIKTSLNLSQLRLISLTAHSNCKPGWFSSKSSYVKMANDLYDLSGATDSKKKDSYDLCSGVSNVFAAVNESIKYVEINHAWRYWPMLFANSSHVRNDFGEIKVFRVNGGTKTEVPSSEWSYYEHTGPGLLVASEDQTYADGAISGKHFIRFNTPVVSPPNCIVVTSSTRTEYFGYVVLTQEPKPESIVLRINGKTIPKSNTDGWSYVGNKINQNIKMPYPQNGDQFPAVNRSGFMLQLNGAGNYYKSGDSVEANFIAAPL